MFLGAVCLMGSGAVTSALALIAALSVGLFLAPAKRPRFSLGVKILGLASIGLPLILAAALNVSDVLEFLGRDSTLTNRTAT